MPHICPRKHTFKTSTVAALLLIAPLAACALPSAVAQSNYPPVLPGSTPLIYKTVGDVELQLWLYQPDNHQAETDRRPAVVFFFGGGWKAGTPAQFEAHCQYLASRGIIAATADYRVATRHGCTADVCVEDAKSAVRWLRQNSAKLGIDPKRICAAGGSAGGHTACCTAVINGFEAANEDHSVSSKPNALALFNPAVQLAPLEGFEVSDVLVQKFPDIATRTGVPPAQLSPVHHVSGDLPPTIILHGEADVTVPFATVQEYTRLATLAGGRCELHGFPGAPHGFFNGRRGKTKQEQERFSLWQRRTLRKLDEFLASLNWLDSQRPDRVVDEDNVILRGQLHNSFLRFSEQKTGHVAFLGGSITEMAGYRPRIAAWLQQRFPDTDFQFTDAGIGSTCSNTGAFRLQQDVLSQGPVDLLFVEFAVNDDQDAAHAAAACVQGMEGIIAHTRRHNPNADIIMTHFVNPGMLQTIAAGQEILSASQHEQVARHYQVSSVYLSKAVAARIAADRLTWQEFGGTHPGPVGNQLATDLVTTILEEGWRDLSSASVSTSAHVIPEQPLLATSLTNGALVLPETVDDQSGWQRSIPDWKQITGSTRDRFLKLPMLHSTQPAATIDFRFHGTAVGAYLLAGPDAGRLDYRVDDGDWRTVELYHRYSKGLHYPRTVMFESALPAGEHRLTLRVSDTSHAESRGTAARLIGLTVNQIIDR